MANIIDGKAVSAKVKEEVKAEVAALGKMGVTVGLTVVLVGNDPASEVYVSNKHKTCLELGILSEVVRFPADITDKVLTDKILELNADKKVNGILVQLPLPKHLDERKILELIDPKKDVDCFTSSNVGMLAMGCPLVMPCTPAGIMELLASTGVSAQGKKAVVIGRSNIVGKPMFQLLLKDNATVTVCHTKTADMKAETLQADILVVAAGKAGLVTGDMVKPGAIVLDAGINRVDGKLCGDVDFESAKDVASWITPVPGGVGPMTIAMLMANTVTAAKLQN